MDFRYAANDRSTHTKNRNSCAWQLTHQSIDFPAYILCTHCDHCNCILSIFASHILGIWNLILCKNSFRVLVFVALERNESPGTSLAYEIRTTSANMNYKACTCIDCCVYVCVLLWKVTGDVKVHGQHSGKPYHLELARMSARALNIMVNQYKGIEALLDGGWYCWWCSRPGRPASSCWWLVVLLDYSLWVVQLLLKNCECSLQLLYAKVVSIARIHSNFLPQA